MRDVLFKNLTSLNHHSRDILLSEAFIRNGVTTKTQKHFVYSVRDHTVLKNAHELKTWLKEYANSGPRLKDLSVLKSLDSKTGKEKFEVRITGNLYVLREQGIFNIDFTQVFKTDRKGEALKEEEK